MKTINIKGKEYQYVNHKGDYKLLKDIKNKYVIMKGEEVVKVKKKTDWNNFIKTL